jgi:hypothetical protein
MRTRPGYPSYLYFKSCQLDRKKKDRRCTRASMTESGMRAPDLRECSSVGRKVPRCQEFVVVKSARASMMWAIHVRMGVAPRNLVASMFALNVRESRHMFAWCRTRAPEGAAWRCRGIVAWREHVCGGQTIYGHHFPAARVSARAHSRVNASSTPRHSARLQHASPTPQHASRTPPRLSTPPARLATIPLQRHAAPSGALVRHHATYVFC